MRREYSATAPSLDTRSPAENPNPGSSGRTVPGYALRLTGNDGRDVPPGQRGDLLVRGDSCAVGSRTNVECCLVRHLGWSTVVHAASTSAHRAEGEPRFEIRPLRAGPSPDCLTRGSSPR